MFSTQHGTVESDGYDFTKNENSLRWKGLFTPSLKKVLEQVHPRLAAKDEALLYVETLCLRILAMLCGKPSPHSVQDVEEKVKKSFPAPIDYWALNEAKETVNCKKRKLVLPVDKVHSLLQKDVLQYKIDSSVTMFVVAVLEYISADVLKLAGNYVRKIKHCEITKEDIEVAMCADKVLMDMFYQNDLKDVVLPSPLPTLPTQRTSTSYEEVVKELIHDEKQYQRDLHMIIRVFREELAKIVHDTRDLEPIFSNIFDVYEVTVTLLGSLEDVIEMSQEHITPCVGSCFEELAEAEEFHVYTKYAQDITSLQSQEALTAILSKPDALSLISAGHGFRDAVKYYLPKLLLVPLWHAFVYFDYIKLLMGLSSLQEDIESFEQVQGLLRPLRCDLENILTNLPKESCVPLSSRARRQFAMEKTRELQCTVEHWDKDVGQSCNEFIREDSLGKCGSGKRIAERKVYLFDGLMILCKPYTKKPTASTGALSYDYRLKEKFFMRRVEIIDRDNTDELKHAFEIAPRVQSPVILIAKNTQHKNDWMADLIMVNTKSMLDRILDSILLDIEKKHPLRMPAADIYKFAIPDCPGNIVLEERESAGVPLIKGATLFKLIERLTYHIYADPMFVRTFLTTYRYFCSPQMLLNLLIERFNIPEPSLVYQENHQTQDKYVLNSESDKIHKNSQREDWKRYRKEYVQPVQFRVLNVLRHWVDHHYYDFEKEPLLLEKLLSFLENVNGKSMRKWVDSVLKIVQRKNEQEKSHKLITFAYGNSPPPIEHHLYVSDLDTNLLTLHPLELARQLTLLEFELYKNVKPSELVGSPWTKKDKELKSPNLLKIMKHTTNVTRWIEKSIIEAENYDERVAMVTRAIEVMMVMLELNNFNGILSISAAMGSASVYRLKLTFQGLPARYEKFLEECRELNDGHLKKYQEKLRSINPPCVPFFGRYLTNILHLEEGNPDFLPNTELINFSKRRKVSEIIGEIQQYQNQPYCLMVDSKIRKFLENLDPFKGMSDTDISNFLYHESLRIEPRGCKQAPKFPRKWASITLKSPGIKPRRQNNCNNNVSSMALIQNSLSFGAKIANQSQNDGEQSPPGICTNASSSVSPNTQIYSIFANVNIPERNGSLWKYSGATGENPAIVIKPKDQIEYQCEDITVLKVPKKCAALTASSADNFKNQRTSDSSCSELFTSSLKEPFWKTDDKHSQQSECANNNCNSFHGNTPFSPFVKLIVSPRHEKNFSDITPFDSTNEFIKQTCSIDGALCAAENILEGKISPQLIGMDGSHAVVPISPHINVPSTTAEYRSIIPPPLPPRRRERTESCVDLAQKCQAPDAPTLPPRDDEISPPPIPPRANHSISTYLRNQKTEFMGNNSLLLPNTSSIMIRRNSAVDKNPVSSKSSRASTHVLPEQLNNVIQHEDQAISPALSSSTTTSPLTPMTPISPNPNIPTGYDTSDSSYVSRLKTSCFIHKQSTSRSQPQPSHQNPPQNQAKPSLSGNFFNKIEQTTMFLYPSTNQE